jgi:hypothetical protein
MQPALSNGFMHGDDANLALFRHFNPIPRVPFQNAAFASPVALFRTGVAYCDKKPTDDDKPQQNFPKPGMSSCASRGLNHSIKLIDLSAQWLPLS